MKESDFEMKKILIAGIITFALVFSSTTVLAADVSDVDNGNVQISAENIGTEVSPYADVIVWKYREYNGVLQKRRWNKTKQVWVDPAWINVG